MGGEKKRIINLFCPCLSKIVPIMAWEDQRLDLGSIAGVFGIDPATLKINGHFISRGVDLIASSVTWKSLLSFFSARGLSTGHSPSSPLIVQGKLSKVGSKRSHCPTQVEKGVPCNKELRDATEKRFDDINSLRSKRFKSASAGLADNTNLISNLKRKLCLEDSDLLKKTRTHECDSGLVESRVDFPKAISDKPLLCSLASEKLKRIRDDEMVVTTPFKRIRQF